MTSRDDLHLDVRREARGWFRRWAHTVASGGPRPHNTIVLRAGAVLGVPQPGHLLETLSEAVQQCPEILELEEPRHD